MELSQARYIAQGVVAKLKPCCLRIMIAGSIRRQMKECTDIDLVVIPHRDKKVNMFGDPAGEEVAMEFVYTVNQWPKIKGEATGKYTQRLLPEMVKLEISICTTATWPSLTMIRTGNSDFTHMMMIRARKLGFEQREGLLYDGDKVIQMVDEADYFKVLQVPFIVPEHRDKYAFKQMYQ